MTNRVEPPVVYRHWSGTLRVVRGGGAGWPYPRMEYRDGSWWLEYIDADDWRPIGYGPRRPGRWARSWRTLAPRPTHAVPAPVGPRVRRAHGAGASLMGRQYRTVVVPGMNDVAVHWRRDGEPWGHCAAVATEDDAARLIAARQTLDRICGVISPGELPLSRGDFTSGELAELNKACNTITDLERDRRGEAA